MHCYKSKGTRLGVSQVRLPLRRERGQSLGNNRGIGRDTDFKRCMELVPELPMLACNFMSQPDI